MVVAIDNVGVTFTVGAGQKTIFQEIVELNE